MTQKERFISTGEIEISVHPITGIRRLLTLDRFSGLVWSPIIKRISLTFNVSYLDEEGNPYHLLSMPGYTKSLNAVDEEYSSFISMINSEINIFDIIIGTVLQRAEEGKFDL